MIICSSLSPNHLNASVQTMAIRSWKRFGEIHCFQGTEEYIKLKGEYKPVNFHATNRTLNKLTGKSIVTINKFIDFAIAKKEDLLIINSDIILLDLPKLKKDGISIFKRKDYKENFDDGNPFHNGWDAFFIPYKFLNIYPPSIYAMGACWWDYWIPFRAVKNSVPIYEHYGYAFHKLHPTQYNQKEWQFFGEYFKLENQLLFSHIGQMGNFVLDTIKKNLK